MRILHQLPWILCIFLIYSCQPTVNTPSLSKTFKLEGTYKKNILNDGNKIVNFLQKGLTDSSEKEILSIFTSARISEKDFNELVDLLATNQYEGKNLLEILHLQWDANGDIKEEYDRYDYYQVLVKDSKAVNLSYKNAKSTIEMQYKAEGVSETMLPYHYQVLMARLIEKNGIENLSSGMIKLGKEYFSGPDLGNENSLRRNKKSFALARQALGAPIPK